MTAPVLVAVILAAAAFAVAAWRYRVFAANKRLTARLMPHTVAPREAALPIWLRAGVAEELFGIKVDEEALPGILRWMGGNARRAGMRMGALDILFLTVFFSLSAGAVAHLWLENRNFTIGVISGVALALNLGVFLYGNRRVRRMEEQLADMLDATVGALKAGIGLRQALEVVRGSRRPPISALLNAVLAMTDLGLPLAESLRQSVRHLRSKYFNMLLIALDANQEAGSSLSPMLAGLAQRIRDSIRLRRRIRSLTAEARFSVLAMFAILYAIAYMIWTFRPDNLYYLYAHPLGSILLQVAVVMQVVGVLWMMYLLRSRD